MPGLFYVAAVVAVAATVLALTRLQIVHGLLYLVVSLLAVALVFFAVGAPFVAALEAIIYAGAIIVLFVFVVMMLGLSHHSEDVERQWLQVGMWAGPSLLCAVLAAELAGILSRDLTLPEVSGMVTPQQVGVALYGPYVVGVEIASMLLLSALVGAHHLGRRNRAEEEAYARDPNGARAHLRGDPVRPGADGLARAP